MNYRGYEIQQEKGRYKITTPTGEEWSADSYAEAKEMIDEEVDA